MGDGEGVSSEPPELLWIRHHVVILKEVAIKRYATEPLVSKARDCYQTIASPDPKLFLACQATDQDCTILLVYYMRQSLSSNSNL